MSFKWAKTIEMLHLAQLGIQLEKMLKEDSNIWIQYFTKRDCSMH